jgi:hypothetical protein
MHSPDERPAFRVRNRWFLAHREPRPDAVDAETGERLEDVIMIRVADEGETGARRRSEWHRVIVEGWLCQAPKRLAEAWLTERDEPT